MLGGIAAGFIEGPATGLTLNTSPWTLLLSGILVGIGTKVSQRDFVYVLHALTQETV